jgi:hypothetical protein
MVLNRLSNEIYMVHTYSTVSFVLGCCYVLSILYILHIRLAEASLALFLTFDCISKSQLSQASDTRFYLKFSSNYCNYINSNNEFKRNKRLKSYHYSTLLHYPPNRADI